MTVITIKEGTHGSSFRIPKLLFKPKQLSYNVEFTNSCRYNIGTDDQGDINKLFGIGYFPHHHNNSVRVGWQYDTASAKMNIWAYWYKNKQRQWAFLKSVDINTTHCFSIRMENEEHIIDLGDVSFSIQIPPRCVGYLLMPYFGGNQTAPHDIKIKLEHEKS